MHTLPEAKLFGKVAYYQQLKKGGWLEVRAPILALKNLMKGSIIIIKLTTLPGTILKGCLSTQGSEQKVHYYNKTLKVQKILNILKYNLAHIKAIS